ncbi:MAG: sulfotransferase family 2 domain-containing protein, partial [SAR324 cluster bacterium]|nr:sulfotransferase family 2 domain-containing protein [SAR324 cluster bacterium]
MLISYTHKFIFFHVAKVAGLSIKDALKDYAQEPEKFKVRRPAKIINGKPNPFYEMWDSFMTHVKAGDAQKELPAEIFNQFYKFAFVRNPWDWQVSMYHFIMKETNHINHELVKSMSGFGDYLKWIVSTPKNPYAKGATTLQNDMLIDQDGKIIVDFVGRYESLTQDFQKICQRLQINATLPL